MHTSLLRKLNMAYDYNILRPLHSTESTKFLQIDYIIIGLKYFIITPIEFNNEL